MRVLIGLVCLALVVSHVCADVYLHGPRGSNNRLNEQTAERTNGDRLFDSQNNNRGGYNVGDKTKTAATGTGVDAGPANTYSYDLGTAVQYQLVYYEGSQVTVEWTNQHACGGNETTDSQKINCNIIIQYMCDTDPAVVTDPAMKVILKDGSDTGDLTEPNQYLDTGAESANLATKGHHESETYYYECKTRSRNYGLFHADQNLNGKTAKYTRQNNNGDRNGLECPEERDYFPYWSPSPWIDIVYLTDNTSMCDYFEKGSQNVASTWKCTLPVGQTPSNEQLYPITKGECEALNPPGVWTEFPGKGPSSKMLCQPVGWSRDNHLGNGRFGQPLTFNWTVPVVSGIPGHKTYSSAGLPDMAKCVLRLRYNISTDDYNPWTTDSSLDTNAARGVVSPVTNNPTVDVGADLQGLKLAIDTSQFGRTFQDRTHVFYVAKRPAASPSATLTTVPAPAAPGVPGAPNIINLNVRGKRGNIVQTYPSVEYDFQPNRLHIDNNELIHIQWTGSNTHNNGGGGGDGQAGDAGEGTTGTDRSNFVQMLNKDDNYPIPLDDKFKTSNIFAVSKCYDGLRGTEFASWVDCAVTMATSGQYRTVDAANAGATFDPLLNDAPPSLIGGVVMAVPKGEYNYMCTRNNNFSNRSQKGVIIVSK